MTSDNIDGSNDKEKGLDLWQMQVASACITKCVICYNKTDNNIVHRYTCDCIYQYSSCCSGAILARMQSTSNIALYSATEAVCLGCLRRNDDCQ